MKSFIFASLLFIALVVGKDSHAASTQEILSWCKPMTENTEILANGEIRIKPNNIQSGICWGSFGIIQEIITHIYEGGEKPFYEICAPPESTRLQLINIFVVYAKSNPKLHHQDFFDIALESLRDSFPCEK